MERREARSQSRLTAAGSMKVCVVGAGAIGGMIAAHFARAGFETGVVARGPHLQAMRERGLTLTGPAETFSVKVSTHEDPAAFGVQNIVVIGLKAHQIPAMLPRLGGMVAPETVVVPAINGLPWWYFFREGGPQDGASIDCLDPAGEMFAALDPHRVIGCVVHVAAHVSAPGEIRTNGNRVFYLGEPDRSLSRRLNALADAFRRAGLEPQVSDDIRTDAWTKLIGNLPFNPNPAFTRANLTQLCDNPALVAWIRLLMEEANAVALAYGVKPRLSIDKRLELARSVGPVKSSMLQDLELNRPMEIEPIVGAAVELARKAGVATPNIDLLYAMINELARNSARP